MTANEQLELYKNQIKSNPELENALWNCEFVFDENVEKIFSRHPLLRITSRVWPGEICRTISISYTSKGVCSPRQSPQLAKRSETVLSGNRIGFIIMFRQTQNFIKTNLVRMIYFLRLCCGNTDRN